MEITNCEQCGIKKNWNGRGIICCFQDSEIFGNNWNCGLINKIRYLCELAQAGDDSRLQHQYCNEQHYVTIRTDDIDDMGLCLWVSWYKSRGRTEAMWILNEYSEPKQPKLNELKTIIDHYSELFNV